MKQSGAWEFAEVFSFHDRDDAVSETDSLNLCIIVQTLSSTTKTRLARTCRDYLSDSREGITVPRNQVSVDATSIEWTAIQE